MDKSKIIKSTQEQAVASWINYLNQVRLDRLMEVLNRENDNLNNAMTTISETFETISNEIVNNGLGRGGTKGMHGFIAEVAECGVGNAREQIEGKMPIYEWINDNGAADLKRGATYIQQKFVNSGNHLSLQAIENHLKQYPDFLDNGNKYQIPSDHYDKIKELLEIPKEEAYKMPTSNGEFSLKQWKEVHEFFDKGDIKIESIEPSKLDYDSVQKNTYQNTLNHEEDSLKQRNQERKDKAYNENKPSFDEGMKATAVAAFVEGGMAFCMKTIEKRKEGKKFKDFNEEDWKEIAGDTGLGFIKGGVRGSSIYLMTNYTATPAAVASSIVTASFGVAEQANRFRKGEIGETEFLINSEILCVEATISALSSFMGQVIIPIPVLGAVIGNSVGTLMYQISRDSFSEKEQKLIEEYLDEIESLNDELNNKYGDFIKELSHEMEMFMEILDKAFAPDIRIAFYGSVELAKEVGVPSEEILDSREKIVSYFMD